MPSGDRCFDEGKKRDKLEVEGWKAMSPVALEQPYLLPSVPTVYVGVALVSLSWGACMVVVTCLFQSREAEGGRPDSGDTSCG